MLVLNSKKCVFKSVFVFLMLINILNTNSIAVVSPTSDFYVNDYAKLLNESTKDYIISTNKSLYNQTGSQIVVVTVPSLDGDSLEEYATELFRNFGIGDKSKNNGVLLLLALQERQFRIEVGYGLEGVLTDGKTGRIQDEYIIPYLKQNNWNEGIKNGFSAILDEVSKEYNVEVGVENAVAIKTTKTNLLIMYIPFFSFIIGIILGRLKRSKVLSKNVTVVFSVLYFISIAVLYYIIVRQIFSVIFWAIFNLIWFLPGMSSYRARGGRGGYHGGGFYGGGSSFGGGRRRFLRRRRFFWWTEEVLEVFNIH